VIESLNLGKNANDKQFAPVRCIKGEIQLTFIIVCVTGTSTFLQSGQKDGEDYEGTTGMAGSAQPIKDGIVQSGL
jgi:hypothetical protein